MNSSGDPPLQKSFADTLSSMLNNIKCFGPAEATQVVGALRGAPCGEDQTKRIMATVDSKVAKGSGPVKPEGSAKQSLKEWWCYLTSSDWAVLNNPKLSVHRKMTTMACFKSEKKECGFSRILEYPASPSELPTDIFQSAYPDDGQPTTIELKGINTIADNISLRSNSRKPKSSFEPDVKAKFQAAKAELDTAQSHDTTPAPTADARTASPAGALIPSPTDPCEVGLFYEYQHKLLEYRQEKSQAAARCPEAPPVKVEPRASLAVHCAPDGTRKVAKHETPVTRELETPKHEKQGAVKAEQHKPEGDAEHDAADDDDGPRLEDLGAHARAAIEAPKKRKGKQKEEAKAKVAAKKEAAKAAAEKGAEVKTEAPARKRPAAAAAPIKPAKAVKTDPAAAAKSAKKPQAATADLKPIPKSKIMSAMPSMPKDGSNPPPVVYKQGIIYTNRKAFRFRAPRERGNSLRLASHRQTSHRFVEYLERMSRTLSNEEFVMLQQALGLTLSKRGLLLARALDRLINPTEVFMHDYMHALFVDGVVNLVIYLTFEEFISAGLNGVWESFSDFLATWVSPGRLHATHLDSIFNADRKAPKKSRQLILDALGLEGDAIPANVGKGSRFSQLGLCTQGDVVLLNGSDGILAARVKLHFEVSGEAVSMMEVMELSRRIPGTAKAVWKLSETPVECGETKAILAAVEHCVYADGTVGTILPLEFS
ncbi:unnamed protein product [Prorocentrum cordatum]|uniref:Uncharacterized protein n=1 Tax=Prorocentrum cordatum TaxID=2364126 RepID=A0ABN9XNC9_9DINO|nr:unnamed protein product [Polarella glacialis]